MNSTVSGLESHRSSPVVSGRSVRGDPTTYNDGFWEPPADYHHHTGTRRDEDQLTIQTDTSIDSNKYKSFSKLIARFAEKTSMQGVPYINSARLWYAKLIWTCLLVIAIGWMCFHLYYLITQFLLWPIQTKIKLSFSNLEMPAVTICNVNPIRISTIDRASKPLQDLVKYVDPSSFLDSSEDEEEDEDDEQPTTAGDVPRPNESVTVTQPSNSTGDTGTVNVTNRPNTNVTGSDITDSNVKVTGSARHRNATNGSGNRNTDEIGRGTRRTTTEPPQTLRTGDTEPLSQNRRKRFVDDFDNAKIDEYLEYDEDEYKEKNEPPRPPRDPVANLEDTFRDLYFRERRKTRVEMGHHMKDMLISCSFDGYECFPQNFTLYQTAEFGNCFTIQSSTFTSKSPGPKHGLSLILFMENYEYVPGLTQGYGARVTINDQSSFPFPADEGFFVSSAFETHIGLKQINIERLGEPYGQCNDGVEFEKLYGTKYSRQTCQDVCHGKTIIDQCGCHDKFGVEVLSQSSLLDNITPCKSREELLCQFEINKELEDKTRKCECANPCVEKQWLRSTSTRQWPTESYTTTLLRGLCQRRPKQCTSIISKADDRKISLNFMKIVVYYQDLNHEEINEDPEIETAQFASDVGGAIGLWIGLSILSMFEVVQLVVELCRYGLYKCHHLENVDSNPELPSLERKPHGHEPGALNFNQPQFAKDHLYNGRFATARYQY
ncbi:amiloride-sensitive sodium channel subunit gamma-like [Pecten maximus]|uniref:amiloride-sensitive sodium channel subunit gamma-like n=1 Tax=Pecten maximus TaxID=6579 RepID=UPI00145891E5|nr:amiloride-sensitive sodium channel subunit gamma-like [Pecten maximus]